MATHNLAIGVVVGVARRDDPVRPPGRPPHRDPPRGRHDADGTTTAVYRVTGELFFASSNDLYTQFEYADDPDHVVIDLSDSHIWDASTVAALDAITTKYDRKGKTVEIVGLDASSAERHERLSGSLPSRPT